MAVNVFAWDAATRDDAHDPEAVKELLAIARQKLNGDWRLVRSVKKMRKTLFEAEWNGRLVIGKVSGSARAATAYDSLRTAWDCGLRPPSRYTIVEPLAWFPDHSLIILEKAPGESFLHAIQNRTGADSAAREAGRWLKALWQCNAEGKVKAFSTDAAHERAGALSQALGDKTPVDLVRLIVEILGAPSDCLRPSHGDFHPMNLFVAQDRVTAIDLDTFALREREADIGYCLAQTANFGLLLFDSFEATEETRAVFLNECGPVDMTRVRAHMAWAFLQSIHYDVCILKVKNEHVGRIMSAAVRLLHGSEVTLA